MSIFILKNYNEKNLCSYKFKRYNVFEEEIYYYKDDIKLDFVIKYNNDLLCYSETKLENKNIEHIKCNTTKLMIYEDLLLLNNNEISLKNTFQEIIQYIINKNEDYYEKNFTFSVDKLLKRICVDLKDKKQEEIINNKFHKYLSKLY